MNLSDSIRDVPDFPKKGILFKDITPILNDPVLLAETVDQLCKSVEGLGITRVAGIEARGFLFGTPVALKLGVGFVPIRKPGKLPCDTYSEDYSLEYGSDSIEVHKDAFKPDDKVLIVDDLLATGGTMEAAARIVEKAGAEVVKISLVIELAFLKGRERLDGYDISSLVTF